MASLRKSIKLLESERSTLVKLYLKWRTPIEQFETRHDDLLAFLAEWKALTGRTDSGEDITHYMRTQRKRGKWVTLDGNHKKAPPAPELDADETEALVEAYETHVSATGIGSDAIAYDEGLKIVLVKEMSAQTGRTFSSEEINTKLTALRKRGRLPKVIRKPNDGSFADIDQAAQ